MQTTCEDDRKGNEKYSFDYLHYKSMRRMALMSKFDVNKSSSNYYGNVYGVERYQGQRLRHSNNNDAEFGDEFDVNQNSEQVNNSARDSRKPVSERTAWN